MKQKVLETTFWLTLFINGAITFLIALSVDSRDSEGFPSAWRLVGLIPFAIYGIITYYLMNNMNTKPTKTYWVFYILYVLYAICCVVGLIYFITTHVEN